MGCVWHSRVHDLLPHGQPYRPSWTQNPNPLPHQSLLWSQGSREVWDGREMHIRGKALRCLLWGALCKSSCPWDGGWAGGSSASRAVRRDGDVCGTETEARPLLSPHPRSKHNPTELVRPSALPLILSPILRLFLVHNLKVYTQILKLNTFLCSPS